LSKTLLGYLLSRLDEIEVPVYSFQEMRAFPGDQVSSALESGFLRETSKATELSRPSHLPPGGPLIVKKTEQGIFGVAEEDDYFEPIPLTEDDVRQFEISVPKLVAMLRVDNSISGQGCTVDGGLVFLGQKIIEGSGTHDVFLSFPNEDAETVLARCQRLKRSAGSHKAVLITPRGISSSSESNQILESLGIIVVPLTSFITVNSMALDWESIIGPASVGPAESYPKEQRTFTNQGKTWLLVFDGIPKSVDASKGMEYIAYLLRIPGQEIHAVALRSALGGEDQVKITGSAGELLDEQALREYKERLKDIEDELREAEEFNDIGRAEKLKEEAELLTAEIGRATGLGDRKRLASDDAKRASQSISKAIHRALDSIKEAHEPIWQHLSNSLKIGEYLSYQPDQPTSWTI